MDGVWRDRRRETACVSVTCPGGFGIASAALVLTQPGAMAGYLPLFPLLSHHTLATRPHRQSDALITLFLNLIFLH